MEKRFFLFLACILTSLLLRAEGQKEIQPDSLVPSNLVLDNGWTFFGQYKATPAQQIKIKIANVGETIYFGMNDRQDAGNFVPNVHFRILDPAGNIVYSSVIPDVGQQGNISNYKSAVAGPKQLGNPDGYDAMSIVANTTGDYVIEYDSDDIASLSDVRLNLQYFDVTVADLNNKAVTGRLHSQGWQISTTQSSYPFLGTVYPYDGGSAVYKVDFNGMRPWVFVINFNSKGTGSGDPSNFLTDRQSKVGNFNNPQYDVFLNPPDPELYPVKPINLTLSGEVKKKSCNLTDFCFTADSASFLEGFLDFNNNGLYDQNLGEVYFGHYFNGPGTYCTTWDGKDANGNIVNSVQFNILSKIGYGLTYLPLYDVEYSEKGFKVEKVNPPGPSPTLYWDDSQIPSTYNIGPKVDLDGCDGGSGCHTWTFNGIDCSSLYPDDPNCPVPTDYGNQNTINTWWYSTVVFNKLQYTSNGGSPVALSFDPNIEQHKDTTVCIGDSVYFYVFNDGVNHFNSANYTYEWKIDNVDVAPDVRSQKEKVTAAMQAVVIATSKTDPTCFSSDTLHVNVVNPVQIASTVAVTCGANPGTIHVSVVSGATIPKFSWTEFPAINSGTLNNLAPGQYHVSVTQTGVANCGADTVLTIPVSPGIKIDKVLVQPFDCNANSGTTGIATVQMVDNTKQYEYSWDNTGFTDPAKIIGIGLGNHEVVARDKNTLCKDSLPFTIDLDPLAISLSKSDDVCSQKTGSITLNLPAVDLNVSWNGVSGKLGSMSNLSAGNYNISVSSPEFSTCKFDTTVVIQNTGGSVPADFTIAPPAKDSFQIGEVVQFKNTSGTASSYLWQFGDGTTSNQYNASHAYSNPGTFVVTLQVTDANGCSNQISKSLTIATPPPCAVINPTFTIPPPASDSFKIGETINFINNTSNIQSSNWQFGDGSTATDKNPTHAYSIPGTFSITLTVFDAKGCPGTVTQTLIVVPNPPCGPAIPNAFSPNDDHMNEDIGLLGNGDNVDLKIFDRWGEMIFRTQGSTVKLTQRWNGIYRGEASPIGVYPFILEYDCPGSNADSKIRHKKVGDITLVR